MSLDVFSLFGRSEKGGRVWCCSVSGKTSSCVVDIPYEHFDVPAAAFLIQLPADGPLKHPCGVMGIWETGRCIGVRSYLSVSLPLPLYVIEFHIHQLSKCNGQAKLSYSWDLEFILIMCFYKLTIIKFSC